MNPEKIVVCLQTTNAENSKIDKCATQNHSKKKGEIKHLPTSSCKNSKTKGVSKPPSTKKLKKKRKRKNATQKFKKRCHVCNKKLSNYSLAVMQLSNTCKCNLLFCNMHLHNHVCSYNFQQEHQSLLIQNNPVCEPKVIDTI